MHDELIGKHTSEMTNELKRTRGFVQSSRKQIQNLVRSMRTRLMEVRDSLLVDTPSSIHLESNRTYSIETNE